MMSVFRLIPSLYLVVAMIVSQGISRACSWDRDTLSQEFKLSPNIVEVITGRFERFPPRYYEMRIARAIGEIATDSTNLALYDDLGVAHDRLHRSEVAIDWMSRKAAEMDRQNLPDGHEHRYRHEANLGTILFHQWLRGGANLGEIDSANTSRDHIARAIEINPDAHFGRERYQLLAMNWIIQRVINPDADSSVSFLGLSRLEYSSVPRALKDVEPDFDEVLEGVTGLITLGSAWESIDAQIALAQTLQAQRLNQLAVLSVHRVSELQDAGKASFADEELLTDWLSVAKEGIIEIPTGEDFYKNARAEADSWQKERFDFMDQKFALGEHPDTHPEFWAEFKYKGKAPKPPFQLPPVFYDLLYPLIAAIVVFGVPLMILFRLMKVSRKRKLKRPVAFK